MLARDTLRLYANRSRPKYAWVSRAQDALRALDAAAEPLGPAESLASLEIAQRLRELLPDEHRACRFDSLAAQDAAGAKLLQQFGPQAKVTLHLGYVPVAFSTTLEAAWSAWGNFCESATDAYNVCLYPTELSWYVVRSGKSFVYPMDCRSDGEPRLAPQWLGG